MKKERKNGGHSPGKKRARLKRIAGLSQLTSRELIQTAKSVIGTLRRKVPFDLLGDIHGVLVYGTVTPLTDLEAHYFNVVQELLPKIVEIADRQTAEDYG